MCEKKIFWKHQRKVFFAMYYAFDTIQIAREIFSIPFWLKEIFRELVSDTMFMYFSNSNISADIPYKMSPQLFSVLKITTCLYITLLYIQI